VDLHEQFVIYRSSMETGKNRNLGQFYADNRIELHFSLTPLGQRLAKACGITGAYLPDLSKFPDLAGLG